MKILVLTCLLAAAGVNAVAADSPPSGVVNLVSSATLEVPKDWMMVTLSATRDGPEANSVQSALKQALEAALVEARKAAKPGQLEVQTGNFSMYPRYSKANTISGWQGSSELVIEGRDMLALSQLVGRIGSLTVARVAYGLSREQREKVEGDVAAQAIARFRVKAADYAAQFGYTAFAVREVNVSSDQQTAMQPVQNMRMKALSASADESLPVEAGKALVSVSVSGSVQMSK
ncbi:MAG: SIMPL domain-containing protein [Pseudorhodobacter sp.]|nr:SIMPL domain-containing protein [Rhizobacter sp.]